MSYQLISEAHPVARKEYKCIWCGEKILKGEKYLYRFYKYEGDLNSGRMHLECEEAMEGSNVESWEAGEFKRGTTESRYE